MRALRTILLMLLAVAVALPLAGLGAFVVTGALAFVYGVIAPLLALKSLSKGIFGVGTIMLFFGFLYLFYELFLRVLLAGWLPQPGAAPASLPPVVPAPPASPIGRTVLKSTGVVAAVCTGLFLCVWLPVAAMYKHQVERRPVVAATISDHHVHEADQFGRPRRTVRATVSFQRTDARGWTENCRLENFNLGRSTGGRSSATTLQLAVHPYSCNEPAVLPLSSYWPEHFGAFVLMLLTLMAGTAILMLGILYEERQQRTQPAS